MLALELQILVKCQRKHGNVVNIVNISQRAHTKVCTVTLFVFFSAYECF